MADVVKYSTQSNLPAEVNSQIQLLLTSPQKYLRDIQIEKATDARPKDAITLSHLKRGTQRKEAIMVIAMMINEVNSFFNVKGNMSSAQIALTAELILDNDGFYDLTLSNIKACFRKQMMSAKLYDRLDGSIIIQWLREFKSEMADYVENSRQGERNRDISASAVSYDDWLNSLKERAQNGDLDAEKMYVEHMEWMQKIKRIPSESEQRKKELDFFRFKQEYIKSKQDKTND